MHPFVRAGLVASAVLFTAAGAAGDDVPVRLVGDPRAISTLDAATRYLSSPVIVVGRATRQGAVSAAYQHLEIFSLDIERVVRDALGVVAGRRAVLVVRRDAVAAAPDGHVDAVLRSATSKQLDDERFVLLYANADRRLSVLVPVNADWSVVPLPDVAAAAARLPRVGEARLLDERIAPGAQSRAGYRRELESCPDAVLAALTEGQRHRSKTTFGGCPP